MNFSAPILRFAALAILVVWGSRPHSLEGEESTPRIAVVAAFDEEMEAIRQVLKEETVEKTLAINGVQFSLAQAYGKPVLFFITHVNTVNAAMTTQLALDRFTIKAVLFAGIAGAVNPELKKGDVAIPAKWHYLMPGAFHNLRKDGSGEYEVLDSSLSHYQHGHFGMHFPSDVSVIREGMEKAERRPFFKADKELLNIAEEVTDELHLINAAGKWARIKVGGAGGTSPAFLDNADLRKYIHKQWNTDVMDMESTAIAHVCWANKTPFLIIRSASDLAGGQRGENEIDRFARNAELNAALVLREVLKKME